ncbi:MAG: hypothetical protein VX247_00990, partial [Pseudomonadota bacterium]|nr:hypothetical protein [Pseudomonadota bacterium]
SLKAHIPGAGKSRHNSRHFLFGVQICHPPAGLADAGIARPALFQLHAVTSQSYVLHGKAL